MSSLTQLIADAPRLSWQLLCDGELFCWKAREANINDDAENSIKFMLNNVFFLGCFWWFFACFFLSFFLRLFMFFCLFLFHISRVINENSFLHKEGTRKIKKKTVMQKKILIRTWARMKNYLSRQCIGILIKTWMNEWNQLFSFLYF